MDEISRKILEKRGLFAPAKAAENGQAAEPVAKPEAPRKEGRRQAAATE